MGDNPINQDDVADQWRHMQGALHAWWGKLTDEDFERIAGQQDTQVGLLPEKYGYTRDQAQHEVDRHVQACGDTTAGPSGSGMANAAEATASLTAQAQEGDATAALRRSNEELQQFCYIVSHDLTEPLRTVTNYLQLLAQRYQGKLDTDADEYLAFAVDGAQRMQELIRALLAYTRVGGSADVVFTSVDCEALLARTLHGLAIAIQETAAEVTHDPLPTVWGDTNQLGLVLQNVIGNALKFRGNTAPRIHISAQREARGWRFAVRDNGIGIASKHGERIFQVFQRLHTRREYPGTGIGLAICKKIIEHHGGRIWMESTPGQGSVFLFTISEMEGEKV